jgi:hypothetical protein
VKNDSMLVDEVSSLLLARGFSVLEDRQAGGFEDILLRFLGEGCEVHLLRERGIWRVAISPPGGKPALAPRIWRYYLDGISSEVAISDPPDSLEAEIEFVRDRLGEVISASLRDDNIGERLTEINWTIVKATLGLDPDMPRPGKPGFGKP